MTTVVSRKITCDACGADIPGIDAAWGLSVDSLYKSDGETIWESFSADLCAECKGIVLATLEQACCLKLTHKIE